MSQLQQNQISNQNLINSLSNTNYQQIPNSNQDTQNINLNKVNEDIPITQTFYLRNLIQSNDIEALTKFLKENKLSKQTLLTGIFILIQKYEKSPIIYKLFNLLLLNGADVNSPIISMNHQIKIEENEKITLLMFAIIINDIELVKIILKYHPDINKIDSKKRNAIIYSVLYNHNDNPEIINLLIKEKGNINSDIEIELNNIHEIHSIFTLSCYKGLTNVVKVLLLNNVNVNYQTKPKGETGLHLAVQNNHFEIVKLLLSHNLVVVEQIDNNGKKPFDIAQEKGYNDIIELFNHYYNIKHIIGNNNTIPVNMSAAPLMMINNNNIVRDENFEEEKGKENQMNNILSQSQNLNINHQFQNNILLNDNPLQFTNQNNNLFNNNIIEEKNTVLSKKDIKTLRNKFSSNIVKKNNIKNYDLQIPIEFLNNNIITQTNFPNQNTSQLNNFIKISNTPTLTLDLTDKNLELELKLNELKNQLKEKMDVIKKYESQISEEENIITSLTQKLNDKEKDLMEIKSTNENYKSKIENLQIQKEDLI